MSQSMIIIVICICVVILTSGAWGLILLLNWYNKRNRLNLLVMLQTGSGRTKFIIVSKAVYYAGKGTVWEYIYNGKRNYVGIPDHYNFHMVRGRVCCGQIEGDLAAVPLFGDANTTIGEEFAILLRTHAFSEAYKEMNSSFKIPLVAIIIIIVVVGIGLIVYLATKSHHAASTIQQVITTTTGIVGSH